MSLIVDKNPREASESATQLTETIMEKMTQGNISGRIQALVEVIRVTDGTYLTELRSLAIGELKKIIPIVEPEEKEFIPEPLGSGDFESMKFYDLED